MAESNIVCCFWIAFRKSERFIFKFSETFLVSGTNHSSRVWLVSDMSVKVDSIILRSSMSCREKSFVRYNCWASVFHNGILLYKNFFLFWWISFSGVSSWCYQLNLPVFLTKLYSCDHWNHNFSIQKVSQLIHSLHVVR